MQSKLFLIVIALALYACGGQQQKTESDIQEAVEAPADFQAISLLGDTLRSLPPSATALQKLDSVKAMYEAEKNLDNLIWYGRFTAYAGDYRESIAIYSKGLETYPNEPRILRHRGHRYISVREFDNAILDLANATVLVENAPDKTEADGAPNPAGIPIGSLKSNIDYHLGLAYYLNGDFEKSAEVYKKALDSANNVDNVVSAAHWYFMSQKLLGNDEAAMDAVKDITADMEIIENFDYHKLCLLYNGTLPIDSLTIDPDRGAAGDALAYGIGNWHFYNGDTARAKEIFENLIAGEVWASFGHIAAEAHYAREFANK